MGTFNIGAACSPVDGPLEHPFSDQAPANPQHLTLRIPCSMLTQKPLGGAAAQGLFVLLCL
ncbi:hypothetical protein, partial [Achromobacter sp. DH1f]|uniref:hypothetical protein n=1 Tax=Achromobacter sp. DH1f TaxID=1397275 RepID=UPI001E653F32